MRAESREQRAYYSSSVLFVCLFCSFIMAAEGEEVDLNTEVDESMLKESEGDAEGEQDAVCS